MRPSDPRSAVLTPVDEAMIVEFRRRTLLPLERRPRMLATIPSLTRSALHRCLKRHGISRLPESEDKTSSMVLRKPRARTRGFAPEADVGLTACGPGEACASFRMPVHSIIEAAECSAAEPLLLTIGRAGVLSSRTIAAKELETLLHLLGPLPERQRTDFKRATDIVLIENGAVIYWPRTSEQFHITDAAYAIARVQATLA